MLGVPLHFRTQKRERKNNRRVENFANLDTRTESMRSSFEDAKKTKMLSEKRLEDLNHKAKHIRLNGVDFNDDLSKRLDQVESEQDELRPTLKNSKALCRKSLTAMMKGTLPAALDSVFCSQICPFSRLLRQ